MNRRDFSYLVEYIGREIRKHFAKEKEQYEKKLNELVKAISDAYINDAIEHITERPYKVQKYTSYVDVGGVRVEVPEYIKIGTEISSEIVNDIKEQGKELIEKIKAIDEERDAVLRDFDRWVMLTIATDGYKKLKIPKRFAKFLPEEFKVLVEE